MRNKLKFSIYARPYFWRDKSNKTPMWDWRYIHVTAVQQGGIHAAYPNSKS